YPEKLCVRPRPADGKLIVCFVHQILDDLIYVHVDAGANIGLRPGDFGAVIRWKADPPIQVGALEFQSVKWDSALGTFTPLYKGATVKVGDEVTIYPRK